MVVFAVATAIVLDLHRRITEQSSGRLRIRDLGLLKSAIAQPRMTSGSEDLYPTVIDKAVVLVNFDLNTSRYES